MQQPFVIRRRFQTLVGQHGLAVFVSLTALHWASPSGLVWSLVGALFWGGSYAVLGGCYFSCFGAQHVRSSWRILSVGWSLRYALMGAFVVGLACADVGSGVWVSFLRGALCAHVAVVFLSLRLGRE